MLSRFADEFTFTVPGAPEIPYAGTKTNQQELAGFFQELGETITFSLFEPREYFALGDRVVALGRYAGSVNKSGGPFDGEWAMVWTVRDGKVIAFQEHSDPSQIKAGLAG